MLLDRERLPRELKPFVDDAGRLRQWPARRKVQRMALERLALLFETGREYSEREVNERLMDAHLFADWALLRRELCDGRWLARESDGSRYWRVAAPQADEGRGG